MGQAQAMLGRSREPPSPPPLLQLPVELVLEICDHVDAVGLASIAALAVTCKALYSVISANNRLPQLEGRDLTSFLRQLARDLGDTFYLCQECWRLHRFCSDWGPEDVDSRTGCRLVQLRYVWPYQLGWYHVHLVMNRHRLGGTNGLPLRNLEVRHSSVGVGDGTWHHDWSARIIDGDLFLRARHTIRGHGERDLRRAVGHEHLFVCNHIRMHSYALTRPEFSFKFKQRQGVVGSCKKCLTDYNSRIVWQDTFWRQANWTQSRGRRREIQRWSIKVTAYHQVGDGRSIRD
ncbi:hypothetical protein VPNG_04540 [Cytospora leucostoma]|uniref:F-box domain-containing protein n=1 Tax=Cytospora leucostoma TaxID=1230097 RepID=A0A423XCD8_9PEZI|nr:hypothetical protein VPNG_04540 [Cytospora leucostoma]